MDLLLLVCRAARTTTRRRTTCRCDGGDENENTQASPKRDLRFLILLILFILLVSYEEGVEAVALLLFLCKRSKKRCLIHLNDN